MGDFNLKTATNYKVPESQRQGATFKRAQLLELRRMIYMTKMSFNEQLLGLRDRKQKMIAGRTKLMLYFRILRTFW